MELALKAASKVDVAPVCEPNSNKVFFSFMALFVRRSVSEDGEALYRITGKK